MSLDLELNFFKEKCNAIPSIERALDYIYRIHGGIAENIETKVFGHIWKYKRKLLTHMNAHKVISTFNVVNVEPCIEAP